MEIDMILACGTDGSIGIDGGLIWRIPEDLRHFRALTTGHPVVMGRKTWESLPRRPLHGRLNIVMTRDSSYDAPGAVVVSSPEEALAAAERGIPGSAPFVIGGEQVYRIFLPLADRIHVTAVEAVCPEADARLPWPLPAGEWVETESTPLVSTPEGVEYSYKTFCRKR